MMNMLLNRITTLISMDTQKKDADAVVNITYV
jgi:hypothetical protein